MKISEIWNSDEYSFLHRNEHLKDRIILLGVSGSHAYGTNNENSDIDLRGICLEKPDEIIGLQRFEQYTDEHTDSVIFGFNKVMRLLIDCNPALIELLGLDPAQYIYLNDIGKQLVDNRHMFLSKKAARSFGGYADMQLRRLQNANARDHLNQAQREEHIRRSVQHALDDMVTKYKSLHQNDVNIYIDKAVNENMDMELFMDATFKHMPLRDYKHIWNNIRNVIIDYDKIGARNHKKDDNHLNKHAMHLVRLFHMAIEILEEEEIHTRRTWDLPLLRDIRAGKYMSENHQMNEAFYEIVKECEARLHTAMERTALPETPDMEKIEAFMIEVNKKAITGEKL